MLITLLGEGKKRERILTRKECWALSADAVNQALASCWREEAATSRGGAGGGIRVTRLRLNGRRQIEEADGDGGTEGGQRGHCSARSPGEDVTSGLKHVAGLRRPCKVSLKVSRRVFHPRLPTNPNRRRRNTCRRCGKAMEEEGGGGALPTEGPYRFIYLFCSEKAAGGKQVAPPSR